MRKFLLFILAFSLFFSSHAQTSMEDVVYLKNGSIIRGVIIEQVPFQSLKIQTRDRNVFVFKMEEIEKMTKENSVTPSENKTESFQLPKSGFTAILEINRAWGFEQYSLNNNSSSNFISSASGGNSLGIKFIGGLRLSKHIMVGFGTGLDLFPQRSTFTTSGYLVNKMRFVPLTFDLRTNLTDTRWAPTINLAAGYAIGVDGVNGGLIISPQLGCQGFITEKVGVFFNVGYKWQGRDQSYVTSTYYSNGYYRSTISTRNILFGYLTLNTGFSF